MGGLGGLQTGLDVAGVIDQTGTADLINAALYALQGQFGYAGISLAGAIPIIGDLGKVGKYGSKALRYSDDAAALVDLAKQAKRTGVDAEDAKTLLKWADEYKVKPARGPEIHPKRNFQDEHIHVGPVDHIIIK
jgi:hypothetical protein